MAEPLRTFALSCVQQAQTRVYEGRPYEPWNNLHRHSLPPPPDKPEKSGKIAKISSTSMIDRPNMALVTTSSGKRRWELSPEVAAEAERRMRAGEKVYRIARTMGVSANAVRRVANAHQPVKATPANQTRQQTAMVAMPAPAPACTSIAQAARFAFEVPVALPRITRTARVSTDPRSGTYVLDWAARLARLEFEGQPEQGKPKRSRPRKAGSAGDFRSVYPWPHMSTPSTINPKHVHAINCAAPAPAPISPFD